jgi:hypothetical protein
MSAVESIVRPFQTTTDPTSVVAANQVGVPILLLTFGRSGSGVSFTGTFNQTVTYYQDKVTVEQSNLDFSPEMQMWAEIAASLNNLSGNPNPD